MSKTKNGNTPHRRQTKPNAENPMAPQVPATAQPGGKLGLIVGLMRRASGARVDEMTAATGWQPHTVRGAISGSLKKRLGLSVTSTNGAAGRIYRIGEEAAGG